MNLKNIPKFLFVLFIFLTGCAGITTASSFNQENIDRIYIGMSANSVRQIFGAPNEVRTATCGSNTSSGSWVCETWKYQTENRFIFNDFVFSVDTNEPGLSGKKLNNWKVRRR